MQRQEWLFVTLKNLQGTVSKTEKHLPLGKAKEVQVTVNIEKDRKK